MTVGDPIGDMLARIRNAQQRAHPNCIDTKFEI